MGVFVSVWDNFTTREDFSPRELNQPGHFVAMILVFVKREKFKIQKNVSETKTPGIRKQDCGLFAPDPSSSKEKTESF